LVVAVVAAFRMPLRQRCVLSATLEALVGMGCGETLRRGGKFGGLARALFWGPELAKTAPDSSGNVQRFQIETAALIKQL
jgi:hypothetical protein